MLPDANDAPALAAELAGDAAVAGHVGHAFAVPESAVGFRAGVALGAAVPEPSLWDRHGRLPKVAPKGWHRLQGSKCRQPSVDEDGDLLFGNGKVGLSRQRKMPSPSGDLVLPQQREQRILHLIVALAPDEGHDLGALPSGPNIWHEPDMVES